MKLKAFLALASVVLFTAPGYGQAIISTTSGTETVYLGVNALGHLNVTAGNVAVNASATGLAYSSSAGGDPTGGNPYDATSPGCLCEGWGVSASGVSGYANESSGTAGLTPISFASTASTATSKVGVTGLAGLTVEQAYAPAVSGALFEDTVTITNNTGGTISDVRYVRVMDWDIPFTEFDEYVTIQGTATTTDLELSHDNGFSSSNPLAGSSAILAGTTNVDFVDSGPADHGAYFKFNFGDLDDGESVEFKIYYGAATDQAAAEAALAAVSAELFSLGQSSDIGVTPGKPAGDPVTGEPITYMFGFSGVGGEPVLPPIPEPGTMAIWGLLSMVGAVIGWRHRRNNK